MRIAALSRLSVALLLAFTVLEGETRESDGAALLETFRQQHLEGDYSLLFSLRQMPRRGDDTLYRGQLWGTWIGSGSRTLFRFSPLTEPDKELLKILVENGPEAKAWRVRPKEPEEVGRMDAEGLFQPLLPGLTYTPFDLQMPFLYWAHYVDEGSEKLKGRKVRSFLMLPPENLLREKKNLGGARLFIDEKFKALIKVELLGPDKEPLKTFKIISIKKIGDQFIIKRLDLLDERTRDKTRFTVVAAALGLELPAFLFEPESLLRDEDPVSPDQFVFFR